MGLGMSFLEKAGLPSPRVIVDKLYDSLRNKNIREFDEFHKAILEVFTQVNSSMPGLHFDVPAFEDVENCYKRWPEANEDGKKVLLRELLEESRLSKTDNAMLVTGVVAPPASMILKKKGENIPPFNNIRVVPDVFFVPTATLLALVLVKLYRKNIVRVDGSSSTTGNKPSSSGDSASKS